MNHLNSIAYALMALGALNWGLVGAFDMNLVLMLLGTTQLTKLVYILIGLSGLWGLKSMFFCRGGSCSMPQAKKGRK